MCELRKFETGYSFVSDDNEGCFKYTVIRRDDNMILCQVENEGNIRLENITFEVKQAPNGREYIVLSEHEGEEKRKYVGDVICSYEGCIHCTLDQCTTGQVARELGEKVYEEYIEAYHNFMHASSLMNDIEERVEAALSTKGKKLAEFEVKGEHYIIYGNYVIEQGTYYNDEEQETATYHYPEFDSLTAKIVKDGKEIDFSPSGATWTGRKYEVCDMIQDFLAKQIQYSKLYKSIYVEKGLQELIDWYHYDIAIVYHLLQIPKRILSNDMHNLYDLELVTSEYIYYIYEDLCLMLNAETHEVVSDNYFASEGYFESIENIKNGKSNEKLIWGKIPEE